MTAQRLAVLAIIAITIFGFGLRLYRLDWEPLHVDELRQAAEVQAPLGEVLSLANRSVGAPLDHLIGKALVTVAPATDFTQRLPAAVFGTASVGLAGLLLLRDKQLLAAVLASLFVAVSPLSVEMSQYIRPYALPVAMVLATLAVYQHWELGSRHRRTAVVFAVVAVLALLSRPLMPMIALATLGFLALLKRTTEVPLTRPVQLVKSDPLALGVLPMVFILAWVPNAYFAGRSSRLVVECWSCDKWGRVANAVKNLGDFGELAIRPLSLTLLLIVGTTLLMLPSVRRALRGSAFIWLPLLITAPLLTFVYATALQPGLFFAIRYLVFLPIGLALYFAIAIEAIVTSARTATVIARAGVVLGVFAVVTWASVSMLAWTLWQLETQDLADWKSVSNYIESIEQSGDVIVSIDARPLSRESKFGFMGVPRYYQGSLRYVSPSRALDHPEWAIDAGRYHFVIFVPKMAPEWAVPDGWDLAEFSEMMVFSTPVLPDHASRMAAWWKMTQQLRPDVAIASQIAGARLEAYAGSQLYAWADVALLEAEEIGQGAYAQELLEATTTP